MDWQLALILAAVTALAVWILWDLLGPLVEGRSDDE